MSLINKMAAGVFGAVVLAVAGVAANAIREYVGAKTDSQSLVEIADAVADAVEAKFQTYVDEMKDKNLFDAEAQKKALQEAVKACIAMLSDRAKQYIEKVSGGDLEGYLTNKIEAEVHRQKSGVMTITN